MANQRARLQEIANRSLQDRLAPEVRERFDEAIRRGMISPAKINEQAALRESIDLAPTGSVGAPGGVPLQNEKDIRTTGLKMQDALIDFAPDIAATAGSIMFPPLAHARAAAQVSKAIPKALPMAFDAAVAIPGLGPLINKATRTLTNNLVRFSPNVAGAAGGGFVGSVGQQLAERETLKKIAGTNLDSQEAVDEALDIMGNAITESGRQAAFELGGSGLYKSFESMIGPNANLLAKEGKNVIRYARENGLSLLPSNVTGTSGYVESILEAFYPLAAL